MKKRFVFLVSFAAFCAAAAPADFTTWLPVDGNLHREKAKYIQVVDKGADFNGAEKGIYSFSTTSIPAKDGQFFTVTATVSGNGKGRIGFLAYSNMAYAHCDGDAGTDFVATKQPKKRKFQIKIVGKQIRSVRPTMITFGGVKIQLRDVQISIEDPKVLPAGVTEISGKKWFINAAAYAKTPRKYLNYEDESTLFSGIGTTGIDFFNTEAIPVKSGQVVTIKMVLKGKGKAWVGPIAYKDMSYAQYPEASRDISFVMNGEKTTHTFCFEMKGKQLKSVRMKFILTAETTMELYSMTVTVTDK